jgi:hypothetical protein
MSFLRRRSYDFVVFFQKLGEHNTQGVAFHFVARNGCVLVRDFQIVRAHVSCNEDCKVADNVERSSFELAVVNQKLFDFGQVVVELVLVHGWLGKVCHFVFLLIGFISAICG